MKNLIIRFFKEEEGQTSTEYILLVAVVAMVVFKFKNVLMGKLVDDPDSIVNQIFGDKIKGLLDSN